jgi:hypothetical protein
MFKWGPDTSKLHLSTDAGFTADRGNRLLWNAQLHQLLPGFSGTIATDPNWFIFKHTTTTSRIVKSSTGSNQTMHQMVQEISSLPVWNPIASIALHRIASNIAHKHQSTIKL